MLQKRWSPEQVARRLRHEYPREPEMWVSPETIYQSLYVQGRGALRTELRACLRTGRVRRRPQHRAPGTGEIPDMVLISDRPAEVEDRAVPGHWEGDLLIGKAQRSAIATLVERQTRFAMLVRVESRTAADVRTALARQILTLPEQLRRTLTWDRGSEMAEHVQFTIATGIQVYFCDPRSPWQRGSNENTNGLLRQYFPRGTDLSVYSQAALDDVARELNDRPRQTLGWLKPSECSAAPLRTTDLNPPTRRVRQDHQRHSSNLLKRQAGEQDEARRRRRSSRAWPGRRQRPEWITFWGGGPKKVATDHYDRPRRGGDSFHGPFLLHGPNQRRLLDYRLRPWRVTSR